MFHSSEIVIPLRYRELFNGKTEVQWTVCLPPRTSCGNTHVTAVRGRHRHWRTSIYPVRSHCTPSTRDRPVEVDSLRRKQVGSHIFIATHKVLSFVTVVKESLGHLLLSPTVYVFCLFCSATLPNVVSTHGTRDRCGPSCHYLQYHLWPVPPSTEPVPEDFPRQESIALCTLNTVLFPLSRLSSTTSGLFDNSETSLVSYCGSLPDSVRGVSTPQGRQVYNYRFIIGTTTDLWLSKWLRIRRKGIFHPSRH